MPFQGLAATCLGWERGRNVEPTVLTSDPGGEDAFRPCSDAAPFPVFGLSLVTLGMRCQEGLKAGMTQAFPERGSQQRPSLGQ